MDIRQRIHDVTLLALKSRRFDRRGLTEVVQAVTDGMALGAEQSRGDLRKALSEAFRGMDLAVTRSAEAGSAALRQLAITGKDCRTPSSSRRSRTCESSRTTFCRPRARPPKRPARGYGRSCGRSFIRARTTGTETGRVAALSMTEFAQRFSIASLDVALAGMEVAAEVGSRFAQLASGILGGIADALARPAQPRKSRS